MICQGITRRLTSWLSQCVSIREGCFCKDYAGNPPSGVAFPLGNTNANLFYYAATSAAECKLPLLARVTKLKSASDYLAKGASEK